MIKTKSIGVPWYLIPFIIVWMIDKYISLEFQRVSWRLRRVIMLQTQLCMLTVYKKKTHKMQKTQARKESINCCFCGQRHELIKTKCPAFGKNCKKCEKSNHFAEKCITGQFKYKSGTKHKFQMRGVIQSDSSSDSEYEDEVEECLWLKTFIIND